MSTRTRRVRRASGSTSLVRETHWHACRSIIAPRSHLLATESFCERLPLSDQLLSVLLCTGDGFYVRLSLLPACLSVCLSACLSADTDQDGKVRVENFEHFLQEQVFILNTHLESQGEQPVFVMENLMAQVSENYRAEKTIRATQPSDPISILTNWIILLALLSTSSCIWCLSGPAAGGRLTFERCNVCRCWTCWVEVVW